MVISEQAPPVILLVEDAAVLIQVYIKLLGAEPAEVVAVETLSAAREFVSARAPAIVFVDIDLPDGSGLDLLRDIRRRGLDTAIVVMTADGSIDGAVTAMRLGADDILVKPFPAERLSTTLRHVLERRRLARIAETIPQALDGDGFEGFIGASPAMRTVYTVIERLAHSRAWVFITGESGTGRTVCARAIHNRSALHLGPFVALDCSALPKDRLESEIFGQVRSVSSGAVPDREGAAARADGGTLFLDGVCEMDAAMQVRLLQFVQTGLVQRVGGGASAKVDVRLVCATNRDPVAEIAAGRFREDLYYRLHVVPIALPPLRERGDDVLLMARRFLVQFGAEEGKQFDGFSPGTEDLLLAEPWPGNVRQLQNVIRTIAVLGKGGIVTPGMLPREMRSAVPRSIMRQQPNDAVAGTFRPAATKPVLRSLAETERIAIEDAIVLCSGNLTEAAKHLDINVSTIHRKRQSWLTRAS